MKKCLILASVLLLSAYSEMSAQATRLVVRARAKDAKFIGTKHAGAYGNVLVKVSDAASGKVLAQGITTGDSGDTKLLLETSLSRYQRITNDSTARFEADITLDEPTLVTISLAVPANKKFAKESAKSGFSYKGEAATISSTQVWLIPGKPLNQEGIIVEIPGLVVDIEQNEKVFKLADIQQNKLNFKSHLALQCGCVITSGGLWDADVIEVKGTLKLAGKKVGDAAFKLTGPSLYEGAFDNITQKGKYELKVYAYDSKTKNTGLDTIYFEVK